MSWLFTAHYPYSMFGLYSVEVKVGLIKMQNGRFRKMSKMGFKIFIQRGK